MTRAVAGFQALAGERAGEAKGSRAALHKVVAEVSAREYFLPRARLDRVVNAFAPRRVHPRVIDYARVDQAWVVDQGRGCAAIVERLPYVPWL